MRMDEVDEIDENGQIWKKMGHVCLGMKMDGGHKTLSRDKTLSRHGS